MHVRGHDLDRILGDVTVRDGEGDEVCGGTHDRADAPHARADGEGPTEGGDGYPDVGCLHIEEDAADGDGVGKRLEEGGADRRDP